MPRIRSTVFAVVLLAAAAAGCGDKNAAADPSTGTSTEPAGARAADGDWLLHFNTAEGADGEEARAVYVRFNPTTGAATARTLPAVTATAATTDEQALLVSADHARAILDTGVPKEQRNTGKLVLYVLADETTETVDIRALTGKPQLRPVAWAFDPRAADTLRVVDSDQTVWKVDLAAKSATEEGRLPRREGWIFGNGFDHATGKPYVESIDSDQTEPAGNGDSDVRPVERQGGRLFQYDGSELSGLPAPPCGFAGGFTFDDGTSWLFCADTPSISAYRLEKGDDTWTPFGKASPKIIPAVAAELPVVLPPVA